MGFHTKAQESGGDGLESARGLPPQQCVRVLAQHVPKEGESSPNQEEPGQGPTSSQHHLEQKLCRHLSGKMSQTDMQFILEDFS